MVVDRNDNSETSKRKGEGFGAAPEATRSFSSTRNAMDYAKSQPDSRPD